MDTLAASPSDVRPVSSAGAQVQRSRGWRGVTSTTAFRIFVTVWLVYTLHFASDVARETYLAITLGESLSLRVDKYLGLHPDVFELEGRGAYINNNPGASILGAVPYALARPLIDGLFRLKPSLAEPKPPALYDDPRPNRNRFMNEARARGLDIKLGLAAVSIHAGLMVPLGAASAVLVFLFLRARLRDERAATWLALLYAFGTPIFFRTAFLNQNVLIAHAVLGAYVLAATLPAGAGEPGRERARLLGMGGLLGLSILIDYSGVALALAFGVWLLVQGARRAGPRGALQWGAIYSLGAALPIALLFGYQWAAFGHPLLPAQSYMPATTYSVYGWNGFVPPNPELMVRNLFDPAWGLFAFSPVLMAALAAPFVRRPNGPSRDQLWLIFGAVAALFLFISSVQFAFLQWNTGVRYLVPAVPLLFFAVVPVLLRLPRWAALALVIPTVAVSWSVSMTRASVPEALVRVFLRGFELPWLTVLQKTASGYLPMLADGASPLAIFIVSGVVLWLVWRGWRPQNVG